MSKLAPTSIKYMIKAHIKAKGVVEKPDIIGAVFGQTEGLLGSELDLRELQRTGRIGRIEVNIKSSNGNSEGEIIIPSSLDSAETALIAATLETIERVGPCTAEIKLVSVEDTRSEKRKYVVDKAKDILKQLTESGVPDTSEISEQIKEAVRTGEISSCHGLPCGPSMLESDDIIIVEGRADIVNLLKYGIRNTVAIEGTSVPPVIKELCKKKSVTLFVDGDRGGQLILKEIMQLTDIDYVATAPEGKEVEELTKKEVYKALRDKVPASRSRAGERAAMPARPLPGLDERPRAIRLEDRPRAMRTDGMRTARPGDRDRRMDRRRPGPGRGGPGRSGPMRPRDDRRPGFGRPQGMAGRKPVLNPKETEIFRKTLSELEGTREACIFDENCELLGKVPVAELMDTLRTMERPYAVVFDGRIDYRINDVAKTRGVKFLIGTERDTFPSPVAILDKNDLR
jgi:DNA primase